MKSLKLFAASFIAVFAVSGAAIADEGLACFYDIEGQFTYHGGLPLYAYQAFEEGRIWRGPYEDGSYGSDDMYAMYIPQSDISYQDGIMVMADENRPMACLSEISGLNFSSHPYAGSEECQTDSWGECD